MLNRPKIFHLGAPNRISLVTGILAMFALSACGGGASTDGGASSVQYTGNTAAADISEDNAKALSSQTFTANDISTASSNPTIVQSNTNIKDRSGAFVTGKLLSQADALANAAKNKTAATSTSPTLPSAQISVEYNDTCPVSGSVQLIGNVDDVTKLGNLSVNFVECNDGQVIINGSASLQANAYNAEIDEYTDVVLNYNNLHFVGVDPQDRIDWQVGANLHAEQIYTNALDPFSKIATINLTLSENITGASYKYDNYVTEVVFDRYAAPATATLDVNGRLYHYLYGYIDVETMASLHYSHVDPLTYPDAGGPIVYTGAANKKIRLTPLSEELVNVGADVDGDDFYEYTITVPWTALKNDRVNDNAPVANAGSDITISLGNTASLDGSQSTDADYNLMTFSWTVTSQPAGSDAGLQGANSANPTVTPDMVGTYELELLVGDGWFSDTDTVMVTVTP